MFLAELLLAISTITFVGAQTSVIAPLPTVVPWAENFEGVDGPWASFYINILSDTQGLNGQNFRAFPGLSLPLTLVPVDGRYCDSTRITEPSCAERVVFRPNTSTQWKSSGTANALEAVGMAKFAIDKGTAQPYGLSNVGLGRSSSQSEVLINGMLAGVNSKDFFMALFGLSNMKIKFGELSSKNTFLSQFAEDDAIASISFSYTAGMWGGGNGINGTGSAPPSLVLGGYDASRIDPSTTTTFNITTAISISNPYQFAINLASIVIDAAPDSEVITYTPANPQISDSTLVVFIDSVTPYLWLPLAVCEVFEKAFRLEWNNTAQLYLMNSSTHDWMLKSNRSVTFSVQSSQSTTDVRNYTLSTSALALRATWPLVETDSYYFPLKRASSIYMLGRVFLQETHISVDYERGLFNLSRTVPWIEQEQDLQIILNKTNGLWPGTTEASRNSGPPDSSTSGLPSGAYAGIGVGIAVVAVVLALLWFWKKGWWPFHLRRSKEQSVLQRHFDKAELPGEAKPWVEAMAKERAELQTKEHRHEVIGSGDIQGELPGSATVHELEASQPSSDTEHIVTDRQQRQSN